MFSFRILFLHLLTTSFQFLLLLICSRKGSVIL